LNAWQFQLPFVTRDDQATKKAKMKSLVQISRNWPSPYFSLGSGLAPSFMFAAMSVAAALVVATPLASLGNTILVPSGSIVTIQDGVDAAAPGDTIKVLPGTYASGVVVATPRLKLEAETETGPVIVGCCAATGFTILADQVEIEGFDIDRRSVGISVIGADQVVVENNHIVAEREAIVVTGADQVRVSGNTAVTRNGIAVDSSSNVKIDHNTVNARLNAISVSNSSGTHIDHNEAFGEDAIAIDGSSGTHVDHNFVSTIRSGIDVFGSIGTDVEHNLVEALSEGIVVSSSSTGHIAHNTLAVNMGTGILVSADSCGNEFKDNSQAPGTSTNFGSFDDPAAPCNTYKNNDADRAFPSLAFWDIE